MKLNEHFETAEKLTRVMGEPWHVVIHRDGRPFSNNPLNMSDEVRTCIVLPQCALELHTEEYYVISEYVHKVTAKEWINKRIDDFFVLLVRVKRLIEK